MINNEKLESLRGYILGGGSTEEPDMLAQLETKKISVVDEYVAALKEKWPEEFGGVEKEEEEPSRKAPIVELDEEEDPFSFWLKRYDNTLVELEKFRNKNNKIIFVVKEPKDEVEIIVAGKSVTVDLIKLNKDPSANSRIIIAAEVAKG